MNLNLAKTTVFLTMFLLLSNITLAQTRQEELILDLNKCDNYYNSQDRLKAKNCYGTMVSKYSTTKDTYAIPTIRFNYGLTLLNLNEYTKAKSEFIYVATHEKNNQRIVQSSKDYIAKIDNILAEIKKANSKDKGDYYSSLDAVTRWSNPTNLAVYIKGSGPKEQILKKAFYIWDEKTSTIRFRYVRTAQEADIIAMIAPISQINKESKQTVGVTKFSYKMYLNKKYFKTAYIKVSYQDINSTNLSNAEILAIALHEVGHSLGIISHSDNKNDIMYPDTSSYRIFSPSNRDINTLEKIYKLY